MKKIIWASLVITATFGATATHAATTTFTITPNNNLYWSGMDGKAEAGSGSYMGYGTNPNDPTYGLGVRNKLGDMNPGLTQEDCPQCYYTADELWGFKPLVAQIEPGTESIDHITIGGKIDHDGPGGFPWNTGQNGYDLAERGPRGQGSNNTLPENGLSNYSLIGVWVNLDDDLKFLDPNFDPTTDGQGFTQIGDEFLFTAELGQPMVSPSWDPANDAPFTKNNWEVPNGADALLMAFNGHRGGFAHRDLNGNYFATGEFTVEMTNVMASTAPVPVPGAVWLLGSGLLGLVGYKKRKAA